MLELVNNRFVLDPDLMTYPPFRVLWDRDKTEHKDEALAYLSYIFNFHNPKSSYNKNFIEILRKDQIINDIFPESMKNVDLTNDTEFKQAEALYIQMLRLSPLRFVLEISKQVIDDISKKLLISNKDNAKTLIEEISKSITDGYVKIRRRTKPKKKQIVSPDGSIIEELDYTPSPDDIQKLKVSIVNELIDKVMNSSVNDEKDKLSELGKLNRAIEEYKKAEKAVDEDEINEVRGGRHIKTRERS